MSTRHHLPRDEHSAQLDGALLYEDAPGAHAANRASTMSYAPVPQPLKNYFHAESTRERGHSAGFQHGLYDGTPHSSVLYEPLAAGFGGGAQRPVGGSAASAGPAAVANGKTATTSANWKTIVTAICIAVLLALGVALLVVFMRDEDTNVPVNDADERLQMESSAAVLSASQGAEQPPEFNLAPPAMHGRSDPAERTAHNSEANDAESTFFYMPTPLQTPERSGTPMGDMSDGACADPRAPHQDEPNDAASRRSLERSNKPPPASWFGADAPTRGASSEEMEMDGELGNQQAIEKIYGGGSRANTVLGGAARAPFAQVNSDAAQQIGWAEIGDDSERGSAAAALDANRLAAGSARSMSELYEANLGERAQYRDGSSMSTIVSPEQAAQQAVGHNPDRTAQFDEGRQRAKQITAESAAAIGSIYTKKRQAAAGISRAAGAQQRNTNDSNYEFFDEYSQQPVVQ